VSQEWDLGRLYRLKGAIEQAASSSAAADARYATLPFQRVYSRFRNEARTAIPDQVAKEFDRLFPDELMPYAQGSPQIFHESRALMLSLVGWFDGVIQEARAGAEIEAYAAARVKAERSVGFGTPA
jgi:hypothetical protein